MPKIWTPKELHLPDEFVDALNTLNWRHGRGEVIGFADFAMSGPAGFIQNAYGTVVCQLQYGTCKAKFRVVNGILYFRGHQKKIPQT